MACLQLLLETITLLTKEPNLVERMSFTESNASEVCTVGGVRHNRPCIVTALVGVRFGSTVPISGNSSRVSKRSFANQ